MARAGTTNLSQGKVKGKGQNTLWEILLKRLPRKSWPGSASCMCDHNNGSGGRERNTEKHRQTGKSVSSDLSYDGWNLPLLKEVLLNSYISS